MISRKAWGAQRPRSRIRLNRKRVKGVVIHHAVVRSPRTRAQAKRTQRAIQDQHMGPNGWSDYAYNRGFTEEGWVLQGRGLKWRSAANGNRQLNSEWVAFVVQATDPKMTPKLRRALRRHRFLVMLRYGYKAREVAPHSTFRPTACPGDRARRWIKRKGYRV